MNPVELNIVCFRYRGQATEPKLDGLNERILIERQESGFSVMSPFRIGGRFCLRVAIANHRSLRTDLEALVERVAGLGGRAKSSNRVD